MMLFLAVGFLIASMCGYAVSFFGAVWSMSTRRCFPDVAFFIGLGVFLGGGFLSLVFFALNVGVVA